MTREPLADDATTRETAAVLKDVRSIVDVNVYVRRGPDQRWQLLPLADLRALWEIARARHSLTLLGTSPDSDRPSAVEARSVWRSVGPSAIMKVRTRRTCVVGRTKPNRRVKR